jgi:SOS response regulatory protein OraA/RecX
VARRVIDHVFGDVSNAGLVEAAIAKRLRGRERLKDDAEFRRMYRYLIGQGFESDRVVAALKRRRARNTPDDDQSL